MFVIGCVFVWSDILLESFSRINKMFDKIDNRLDKVSGLINNLCPDLNYCTLFGIGPGGHSSYNGVSIGEGSVLAFDQLYGRLSLEWGWVGCLFWIYLFYNISSLRLKNGAIYFNLYTMSLILFGALFAFGSEFIFVAFSGSLFAMLLGYYMRSPERSSRGVQKLSHT